jgi:hypothetical protein
MRDIEVNVARISTPFAHDCAFLPNTSSAHNNRENVPLPQPYHQTTIAPPLHDVEQPGLEWEEGLFSCELKWTKEPSIDVVKMLVVRHLDLCD